jgi:hypothetical protein
MAGFDMSPSQKKWPSTVPGPKIKMTHVLQAMNIPKQISPTKSIAKLIGLQDGIRQDYFGNINAQTTTGHNGCFPNGAATTALANTMMPQ